MPTRQYPSPSPEEVTALRLKLGLSQAEAAAVVLTPPTNWPRWEKLGGMHPGLWELFQLEGPKVKRDTSELDDERRKPKAPYTRAGKGEH